MCIICVSGKGIAQPTKARLKAMFENNPHGAGYMVARGRRVDVRKGFMNFGDFYRAVCKENFTADDVVVYHFRISTQAGVQPAMTQPFVITRNLKQTRLLKTAESMGMAHNGVIKLTSDAKENTYSDTALFDARYLAYLVRSEKDLHNDVLMASIEKLIGSKMVLLDKSGNYRLIGKFIEDDGGLWYSNDSYEEHDWRYWYGLDDDAEWDRYWHYNKDTQKWEFVGAKGYKNYKTASKKAEPAAPKHVETVKSPYTGKYVYYDRPDTVAEILEAQEKEAHARMISDIANAPWKQ